MQKKLMKNLMIMLILAVLCFTVGLTASAEDRTIVDSGACGAQGDNVTWMLYDDGELVISGEGDMKDYGGYHYDDEYGYGIHYNYTDWDDYDIVKVTIKEGVTKIGIGSFRNKNILSIDIPKSVVSIGFAAFQDCKSIENVIIPEGVSTIEHNTFNGCESLKDINIPDSVTTIENNAFSNCRALTSVTIPDSVTNIGDNVFSNCHALTSVTIPDSVINIGERVFSYCYSLKSITVDINNPEYSSDEYGVLFNKDKSVLIQYPSGSKSIEYAVQTTVQTVGTAAFENSLLEKIILPDGLLTIESYAFNQCFALKEINLPNSLKTIDVNSFSLCLELTELTIPANVEKIDFATIAGCFYTDDIYVKSMTTELASFSMNVSDFTISGLSQDELIDLLMKVLRGDNEAAEKFNQSITFHDIIHLSTIYCHAGSTAEAYAIENDVDYVLTHFYEGDWTYDYDKMIRFRKCIHCDELEIEQLENSTDSNVEIIAPTNPDTNFEVDEPEKNSDTYILAQQVVADNTGDNTEVLKVFDITLKNSDGVHVQPDGSVKVKLPLDWKKDGNYKVYRVNDDGTLTDMNAYRQGSHMVFETDHFSIYVIVEETPSKENFSFFDFIKKIVNWFKEIIEKFADIFSSICDFT